MVIGVSISSCHVRLSGRRALQKKIHKVTGAYLLCRSLTLLMSNKVADQFIEDPPFRTVPNCPCQTRLGLACPCQPKSGLVCQFCLWKMKVATSIHQSVGYGNSKKVSGPTCKNNIPLEGSATCAIRNLLFLQFLHQVSAQSGVHVKFQSSAVSHTAPC